MKINLRMIPEKIAPLLLKLKQYGSFIVVILILLGFSFIVLRIRFYANLQPSDQDIANKLLELKRTQIDQEAIAKIEKLQSTNVDVRALFEQARHNPFKE